MENVWYVSPNGSDTNSGLSEKRAFLTLQKAFDVLTAVDKRSGAAEIRVLPGLYPMKDGLVIEKASLGSPNYRITVKRWGTGEVRLDGGRALARTACENGVYHFAAREDGVSDVYLNGVRMRKARYPKYDAENPYGAGWLFAPGRQVNIYQPGQGDSLHVRCTDPRLRRWKRMDEVELFVFPRFNWFSDTVPIREYDAQSGTVTLARPCREAIYPTDRFYFQNIREELTDPGEWYFDRESGEVLLIPFEGVDMQTAVVTIPTADNVIRIEGERLPEAFYDGTFDQLDASPRAAVSSDWNSAPEGYIRFEHLTIECARKALFLNKRAHGIELIGCTLRGSGEEGVRSLRGRRNQVAGCDICDIGGIGVYMSGGYRDSFEGLYRSCESEIDNNYIHHVGRVRRAVVAVDVEGVGIRVSHNLIHDCSRTGVYLRGNKHVIEYNHIRHVNIETSDTAAINMCDRDLSHRDTVIRYNRIHDVLGLHLVNGKWEPRHFTFGIYLDDFTAGVDIVGNLIYRTPRGGIFIHGNQDVRVLNNVCLEADRDMLFLRRWGRGLEYERLGTHGMSMTRNTCKRNIIASHVEDCAIYAVENCMDENWEIDMKDNEFDENLFCTYGQEPRLWVCQDLGYDVYDRWFEPFQTWREKGHDANSLFADPAFVDPEHDDFRLRPESPAFQLGFEPLPIDEMGPYESAERATWPIVEARGVRETPLRIDYFRETDE